MKNLLLIQLILFLHLGLFAQAPVENINAKWFRFDESVDNSGSNRQNHKNILGLRPQDELRIVQTQRDNSNQEHVRQQQYYQGIPVSGAIMITHKRDGNLRSANGHLIENLSLSITPGITKETARSLALNHMSSDQYAWESEEAEQLLKNAKGNPGATFFPEGKLVIFSSDFQSATAKLTYEFEIYSLEPQRRIKLWVDAHNGNILGERDLIHHCTEPCDVSGVGNTAYYGQRNITCLHDNNYYLKEEGRNIETRNGNPRNTLNWYSFMPWEPSHYFQNPMGFDYENNSNNWGDKDPVALGVHWATEKWHDYMDDSFGWNGYDNQGAKIINVVHYGQWMDNAFWNGAWASYGDGHGGNNPWTSLDMVAHEISHALIQSTANLIYYGESGALNESFADIFAVAVEHDALGNHANWTIGEDITGDDSGLRSMSDFMEYQGEGWHNGLGDYGGVHTNSAVQNHWFYLLSNEIGVDIAARICFHSLTNYLTPHSNYHDARNASIQSALDLFGQVTADVVCTKWNEVGLSDNCEETGMVAITNPSINDMLIINESLDIFWEKTNNINKVNIEYLINSGTDWETITSNVSGTNYTWNVPEFVPGNNIYIRVTAASNNAILNTVGPLPINECPSNAAFTEDSNHTCLGNTILFSNTSQNASYYEWRINGTLHATDINLQWTTDIVGKSEIELRAYNIIGCYNSVYEDIFVADPMNNMAAAFTYRKQGVDVLFSASHPDSFANYTWDFGDGNTGVNPEISHAYLLDNLYTVCLNVENDCGTFQHCEDLVMFSSEGEGGLCGDQWQQYINGDNVTSLLEIGDFIWLGTSGGGLVKISKTDGSRAFMNNSNSGLPNNNVSALVEGSAGNIWIGTYGGLAKYDGTDWEIFNTDNSGLADNLVRSLLKDTTGNVWIGSVSGLTKYDGTDWEIFNTDNSGLPNNFIRCLLRDSADNIWAGTNGGGLAKYDGTDWVVFDASNSNLLNNYGQSLLEDADGNIWLGTNSGLAKYDGTGWLIFDTSNTGLLNNFIRSIMEDADGNIWVGTSNNLTKYDGTNWETFNASNSGLSGNVIQALLEDNAGNIWIGTSTNGSIRYDGTNWETFNTSNSDLPNNHIQSVLEATTGDIWVGTNDGLLNHDGTFWETFNTSNSGFISNYISSLLEDTNGNIWVGTNNGGLAKYDGTNWMFFNTSNSSLPNNYIRLLLEDTNGNIWIDTDSGLTKHNGTDWENFNTLNSDLPSNTIHDLLKGNDGSIWIGTENGLAKYNGVSLENFSTSNAILSDTVIRSLLEDMDGNIWVGTDMGLLKYNGTDWQTFNTSGSGLPGNTAAYLLGDSSGNIWISTNNGLVKYDGTDWEIFNPFGSSLPDNIFQHLIEDKVGDIWIGSDDGLAKYDGTDWEIFNTLNSNLPSNDVTSLSEDSDGNIWIGTSGGLGTLRLPISPNFQPIIHCSKDSSYFHNKSRFPTQNEWRINGEIVSQQENLAHYFDQPGTYEITLIASNEDGCRDVYIQSVTIPAAAQELGNHLPEYLSICGSNPATIDLSSQKYASYQWTDSLGVITNTTAILTTSVEGLYYLTVVDSCDASATDSITVIIGEDCVWPGDTNKDGIVNHEDIIPVGLRYDASGTTRHGADMSWRGQASKAWNAIYSNDIDYKHIDTDGNGLVNAKDKEAIIANYGQRNTESIPDPRPSTVNASYSLIPIFEGVDSQTRTLGISIDIQSNDGLYPPFYGLAFRLQYESPSSFDTLHRPIEMNMDILGTDAISVHQQFPMHTDMAFVATNHQDRNLLANQGASTVAERRKVVHYTIGDVTDLPGGDSSRYLRIIPREVLMINSMGDTIPVKGEQLDIYLPDEDLSFIVVSKPVSCDSIGHATIYPTNTTKSYSYLWDTGETTPVLTAPVAGIHRITVTDDNSDYEWEGAVNIQGMGKLKLAIEDDGNSLHAHVDGGDGNYLYSWDNGEKSASIYREANTDYQVMVMDGNGCLSSAFFHTLPIELLYFSGNEKDNDTHLEWMTVSEENSSHFVVEHSQDGFLFQRIGQVAATGHSSERQSYHFIHHNPTNGTNYYRLRMVDLDETEELSQIVALDFTGKTKEGLHALFPVPAQGNSIFLQYNSTQEGILDMGISTVSGHVISSRQLDLTKGMNQFEIGIETLPKGIYILNLNEGKKLESQRFAVVE